MTSTRSAHAAPLPTPSLSIVSVPELQGNRLRLIVERKVFGGGGPRPERGASWLYLSPTDDVTDHQAWVSLPLDQADALAKACAAFNCIMDAAERDAAPPVPLPAPAPPPPMPPRPPAAYRTQGLITAGCQVAILAGFLPAVAAHCLGLI